MCYNRNQGGLLKIFSSYLQFAHRLIQKSMARSNPMKFSENIAQQSQIQLASSILRQSAGMWESKRRYYTLQNNETQEVVSVLTNQFLEQGSPELLRLAELHQLDDPSSIICGIRSSWESTYLIPSQRKPLTGTTIFGVSGDVLFRDRGFATPKPVTADFYCPNQKTLRLVTEYNGSVFEEEVKLIGSKYRTRQTIISRANEEQMIGQYLETRIAA